MELLSQKALILAAPAQNREGFEGAIERALPLLASRQLSRLSGQNEHIDLWNNYGAKMDTQFKNAATEKTRQDHAQGLIHERYAFYEEVGLLKADEDRVVLSDDSEEVSLWTQQRLKDMMHTGAIYNESRTMYVCSGCGRTIGIVSDRPATRLQCQTCAASSIHEERRTALFMDIDTTPPAVILPRKSQHISSHSVNLPSSVAIERNRLYGLSLESIGSEYVLDPKIVLSMMYGYIADTKNRSNFIITQGTGTIYNTAPYVRPVSPNLNIGYVINSNVPRGINRASVEQYGASFTKHFLPLFAIDRTSDISPQQLIDLHREHTNALAYMEKMTSTNVGSNNTEEAIVDASIMLHTVHETINEGRIREGIVMMRNKLIKHMGTVGLFDPSMSHHPVVKTIKKEISHIYGE